MVCINPTYPSINSHIYERKDWVLNAGLEVGVVR